jgi:hypothetical protein
MKVKVIGAMLLFLAMGSANASLVVVGEQITPSQAYGPIVLSTVAPGNEVSLGSIAGGSVNLTGVPVTGTYDFAEVFEINPTLSVMSALSAAVVISGSNDISEAVLAILDSTLHVIKFVDVTIGGATTTLGYDIVPLGTSFNVALIGNIANVAYPQADYSLNISSVPVPAAVWLFGSAMIGFLGLRRKSVGVAAA